VFIVPKDQVDKASDAVEKAKPQSAVAALFEDAYENPGTTAMVVGGAAATIGLIAASRGRLAKMLPGGGRDGILLVEDTPFMGKAFKHVLEEQGEKVTWFTGIKKLQPFTGITNDGKELVIQPNKFKFAFVDGELTGSRHQGEHVVDALKSSNLTSFGTSTIRDINLAMRTNGAALTGEKPAVLTALVNRTLDLRLVTSAPAKVQLQMDELMIKLRTPAMDEARKKADDVLHKFLLD